MYEMSLGNESDADTISMYMLEDIRDVSQFNMSINRIYVRYKIRNHMKQRQVEWKGALL